MNNKYKLLARYRNRWKSIERIEHTEFTKMTIEEKFLKTVSAIQLGLESGYQIDRKTLKDIEKVRSHWIALKSPNSNIYSQKEVVLT